MVHSLLLGFEVFCSVAGALSGVACGLLAVGSSVILLLMLRLWLIGWLGSVPDDKPGWRRGPGK